MFQVSRDLIIEYAQGLFYASKELNNLDLVAKDLKLIRDMLDSNENLLDLLDTPLVAKSEKKLGFARVFENSIDKFTLNYIYVVIDGNMCKYLHKIYREFKHLYNKEKGILEGKIYTPFILENNQLEKITKTFSNKYKNPIDFKQIYEKDLIGGIKVIVSDQIYDFSLNTKLESIKKDLTK